MKYGLRFLLFVAALSMVVAFYVPVYATDVYDDGQFTVAIPGDWYTHATTQLNERLFMASPWPLVEEDVVDGVDSDSGAMVAVVVTVLPAWLIEDTLPQAATMLLDVYEKAWAEPGSFRVVEQPRLTSHHGHEALTLTFRTDDTTRMTLLTTRDEYLLRLEAGFEEEYRSTFEPLFEEIVASLYMKGAPPVPPLEAYETTIATLHALPGWHVKEYGNHQAFVSREKIEAPEDLFFAGISLLAFDNYQEQFRIAKAPDMYEAWLSTHLQRLDEFEPPGITLNVWIEPVDGVSSLFIESVSHDDDGAPVQTIQVATVKGDTFFVAVFEAPVEEFFMFRPIFIQAIELLEWAVR